MKVELHNVTKSYSEGRQTLTVINGLSTVFKSAKSYAIVGRSGVGKSTLLHLLGALDQPNEGTVLFDSVDLYSLGEREVTQFRGRSIGFVFQFHHLLAEFSAQENVAMPLLVAGASEVEALNAARELLDQMELLDRLNHLPSQLSGGEQQRVAIARALVNHPRLILADEPTGNLDLKTGREIEDLLCRAQQTRQASLIVVTHQRDLAQRMDYVLEMRPGGELVCIQGEGR